MMKIEYILHVQSENIQEFDRNVETLLEEQDEDNNVIVMSRKLFENESKAAYKIKASVKGLISLKTKLDKANCFGVKVYKFEEW